MNGFNTSARRLLDHSSAPPISEETVDDGVFSLREQDRPRTVLPIEEPIEERGAAVWFKNIAEEGASQLAEAEQREVSAMDGAAAEQVAEPTKQGGWFGKKKTTDPTKQGSWFGKPPSQSAKTNADTMKKGSWFKSFKENNALILQNTGVSEFMPT